MIWWDAIIHLRKLKGLFERLQVVRLKSIDYSSVLAFSALLTYILNRFDARLLLDTLPTVRHQSTSSSPTGWSDLPSDTEDTFFFSPDEAEDYRRDKRRRLIDQHREERLKARRAEDGDSEEEDLWGGSDEEVCFLLLSQVCAGSGLFIIVFHVAT